VNIMGETHMQNASTEKDVISRIFGNQFMDILCLSSDLKQMSKTRQLVKILQFVTIYFTKIL
jgi:hypothetical protein